MTTFKSLIAMASSRRVPIYQLGVNYAFLHRDFHKEVYMKVPEGVQVTPGQVCRFKKSLCGLKQALKQWFIKLLQELTCQAVRT